MLSFIHLVIVHLSQQVLVTDVKQPIWCPLVRQSFEIHWQLKVMVWHNASYGSLLARY